MNKVIPPGAALLLDFIYRTEVGKGAPACYNVIFGNRQSRLAKPLTAMTLAEVQEAQKTWASKAWAKRFGSNAASSAAGAAQFMRATLAGLIKELNLNPAQKFDGDMQDRLACHLLKRRSFEAFMAGQMSRTQFGLNLAKEWASFPVLADTRGAHRNVRRGQSYYAGDGLNKSLTRPETVEALLDRVLAAERLSRAPKPVPPPSEPPLSQPAPATPAGSNAAKLALAVLLLAVAGVAILIFGG